MSKEYSYAEAGVNRKTRRDSKDALKFLIDTHKFSKYGKIISLPYGKVFPIGDRYLDLQIEGVGTKVLLAQLAEKYDTIGIDGVAMAVNDGIRSGARPLAVVDNIHTQVSEPSLVKEWMKGIVKGATNAGCIVPGGEIGDMKEVIKGLPKRIGFDMTLSCVGEVYKDEIIRGNKVKPGDIVIGLRSSGIHSNGISLARKVLFKRWGGKYKPYDKPEGLDKELILETLEPTRIYVRTFLEIRKNHNILGAVHITGDAYLKFSKLMEYSKGIGFKFNNLKPQPIFSLIQKTSKETRGKISDKEMIKTFNMGWGFAIVVERKEKEEILDFFSKKGIEAEQIGYVTNMEKIIVIYKNNKIILK
jgi:phosphoribosylformylglycinamidine cyclo-ligase